MLFIAMTTGQRRLTRQPMIFTAVRIPRLDRERWYIAAKVQGISQSEFLRRALSEKVGRVLGELVSETR